MIPNKPDIDLGLYWWEAQPPEIRSFFTMADSAERQAKADALVRAGFPVPPGFAEIAGDAWNPNFWLPVIGQSASPADYPIHPTLVTDASILSWPQHQADPSAPDTVATSRNLSRQAEVGTECVDASGHRWKVMLLQAREIDMAKATADPRLAGRDPYVSLAFRVA